MTAHLNLVRHMDAGNSQEIVVQDVNNACSFLREPTESMDDKLTVLLSLEFFAQLLLEANHIHQQNFQRLSNQVGVLKHTVESQKNRIKNLEETTKQHENQLTELSSRIKELEQREKRLEDKVSALETAALNGRVHQFKPI